MDKQILKAKLKQQAKSLAWRAVTVVILTMTAVITVWVYASFVEPLVGPNDAGWDQDFAQNILGANNNNNDFTSNSVVSNATGSIVEREEYIQTGIGTTTDAASMSTTLFAGQQYVADNMALASNYTSARAGYLDSIPTISGYHTVPTADTTNNAQMRDVVGNKTDAAVTTVGTQKSLMAYIKGLLGRTCGNSVVEIGEGCDDGGTSWSTGACAGDCSRRNYWNPPMIGDYYMNYNDRSAQRYCQEMGFRIKYAYIDGGAVGFTIRFDISATAGLTGWKDIGAANYINEIWCSDN